MTAASQVGTAGLKFTECFDCFLLDMDGVLWAGGQIIEGAKETVAKLKQLGLRVLFVTNNSSKSRREVAQKLQSYGFEVDIEDIVTSGWAAASYLQTLDSKVKKAYVVGSPGLVEELEDVGITCITDAKDETLDEEGFKDLMLDPDVTAVVSGWDINFSWRKLAVASAYCQAGAKLIGTNPDTANRVGGRLMPENGSQLAALEAASGCKSIIAGKPSKLLVETLAIKYGLSPSRTVMVGDRLDTDIAFGRIGELTTVLVLTGVTTKQEAESLISDGWKGTGDTLQVPHFVLDSITGLVED